MRDEMDRRLRPPRSTTTLPAPIPAQADDQWLPDPAKDRSAAEQLDKQPGGAPFLGHSFAAVPIFPEGRAATPPQRSAPTPAVDTAGAEGSAIDDGGPQAEAGSASADQTSAVDAPTTDTARRIRAASGGGRTLEPAIGTTLAPRFGHDLSRVRIHADSEADHLARAVDARAFATGNDIFFRAGVYNPGSAAGMHTLAHEIAHVEQQAAGPVAGTPTATGLSISDPSDPFEQAAQRTADSVMSGGMATAVVPGGAPTATAVQRELAIQRDPTTGGTQAPPAGAQAAPTGTSPATATATPTAQASPDGPQEASTFEGDAAAFFETNMRVDLRTNIAIEGAAIARHASYIVGDKVRAVCEPFERDQETDVETMNLVFSIVGGGASVVEGGSSGSATSPTQGVNIGSRIFRMGLGIMNTVTPKLAGYRTVGSLKDAAIREMSQQAASAGETTAPGYVEYERDVLTALGIDWQDMIDKSKVLIAADTHPEVARKIAEAVLPGQLTVYQDKVRKEYGSQSPHIGMMETSIAQAFDPKMDILRGKLQEAQDHRKHVQEAEAIGGGIAGGAAIGAGLGLLGGPFAPITVTAGAIGGAIIGGVVGAVGAAKIAGWF
jgi:hypothetical protein